MPAYVGYAGYIQRGRVHGWTGARMDGCTDGRMDGRRACALRMLVDGKNRLLRHFAASAVAWMAPECGPEDAVWAVEPQKSPEPYDFLWF